MDERLMQPADGQDEGIIAYHGSPHDFDQFNLSKIGTGEGAQAYGHGLYFAENEAVARAYRDLVGGKKYIGSNDPAEAAFDDIQYFNGRLNVATDNWKNTIARNPNTPEAEFAAKKIAAYESGAVDALKPGHMYEVHIAAHPDHFLDWDKPLVEQPHIIQAIDRHIGDPEIVVDQLFGHREATGRDLHERFGGGHKPAAVAQRLSEMGIKGIKYLDAGSRGGTDAPTRNYVVFDDKHVSVRRKYEQGGTVDGMATGGEVDGGEVLPPGHPQRGANFQNWFGESKVRRRPTSSKDKGPFEPLTVYHGSPKEFSRFNAIGTGVVSHTFGRYETPRHGMFFAEDPSFASSFAEANAGKGKSGAQVYPVHLSIKNPLWATSEGLDNEDVEKLAAVGVDRGWLTRYAGDPRSMWEQFDGEDGKFFTDALKAAGYDGVHMEEPDPETGEDKRVWVALHPTQIKSATGNQGTFDPSDPDITKARGGLAIAKLRQMSDPAVNEAIRVINRSGSSPRDAVTLSKRLLGRQ